MNNIQLTLEQREGKKPNILRKEGAIPGVIYNKEAHEKIQIKEKDIIKLFQQGITESTLIKVMLNNKEETAFIKDYQKDLITDKITHIDFYKIIFGQKIKTSIPLSLIGTPEGVKEGGVLENFLHEVEIETYPKELKPNLEIDISHLKINDSIHIQDIKLSKDTRLLIEGNPMVCHVISSAKLASEQNISTDEEDTTTSTNEETATHTKE